MINLSYCDILKMPDHNVEHYMQYIPSFMHSYIKRYTNTEDQKTRLIARLMLKNCLVNETGSAELLSCWRKDEGAKPYIEGWSSFNISHSGKMVVVVHGEGHIGVDIEKKIETNYTELLGYFHPSEQQFIERSLNPREAFYEIWVKKEALLKAYGTGLVNGLKDLNCTTDTIEHHGTVWYFYPFSIHPSYTGYVCSSSVNEEIIINEFQLT